MSLILAPLNLSFLIHKMRIQIVSVSLGAVVGMQCERAHAKLHMALNTFMLISSSLVRRPRKPLLSLEANYLLLPWTFIHRGSVSQNVVLELCASRVLVKSTNSCTSPRHQNLYFAYLLLPERQDITLLSIHPPKHVTLTPSSTFDWKDLVIIEDC